jgi:hypothetical protein
MTEKKHLSRKELKEDPFFEEISHVITFFQRHQRLILTVLIVLAVLISSFFVARSMSTAKHQEASGYFGMAMDAYKKNDLLNAEDQFLLLAESYDGTEWGKRAYYYLAVISRSQDRPEEETLDYLEAFIASKPEDRALLMSAYQLTGSYYERDGNLIDAAKAYLNAAKNAYAKSDRLELGLRAAYAYKNAGDEQGLKTVLDFLRTLDLNEGEQSRVEVLTQ